MSVAWLFDAAILALLGCFGYLLYRVESGRIRNAAPGADIDAALLPGSPRKRMYPAVLIRQAGIRPGRVFGVYWSTKLVTAVLVPLLLLDFNGGNAPLWALLSAGGVAFFCPDLALAGLRQRRRRKISDSLSFFVNLLVVYLRSGMSLAQAFAQAAAFDSLRTNPLAEEMALLTSEIDVGSDRDAAFARLAERTGVTELKRLAAVAGVGFRLGSPLGETLSAQAEMLADKQFRQAAELVNRKSMEAMLPMMLVCFPVFLVLVFFPAAIQFFSVLGMLAELL